MAERILNNNGIGLSYSSVRDIIRKFNMLARRNDSSSSKLTKLNHNTPSSSTLSSTISKCISSTNETLTLPPASTATITCPRYNQNQRRLSNSYINRINPDSEFVSIKNSPTITYREIQTPMMNSRLCSRHENSDDIGLAIIDNRRQIVDDHDSSQCASSIIDDYEINDIERQSQEELSTPERRPPLPPSVLALPNLQQESTYPRKRTLPLSDFLLEIGILIVIFILCMVLVLAIREDQNNLRITMHIVYTYIYLVSIVWMIWCTFDILKFRRQWTKITSSAHDQAEYMDIVARCPQSISYFPDMQNTSGLFMRIGAGLLCMGSLILNTIQLAKTIEIIRTHSQNNALLLISYSQAVFVTKLINFIFRFIFHCVQYMFLFRYGNIVIDRNHLMARIGLIHIIIANFCTWFEAITIETLHELRKHSTSIRPANVPMILSTTKTMTTTLLKSGERIPISCTSFGMINCFKKFSAVAAVAVSEISSSDSSHTTTTDTLEFIEKIETTMSVYLYPCFIEYSLICVTVFYIMWRNVGKTENRSFTHFGDRHIFTVDCSRASRGLLLGGIVFILAILTLIPVYILNSSLTIQITHLTELVLLLAALLVVCISFFYTTKLYYDRQAHVDVFDQILILVTTVGDFAYSFFGLFASIFIESYSIQLPRFIEIAISFLSIIQTFLQSGFILDTLKRRPISKSEIRKKPGRELITALLLINLAIWMHDSLSAKKVKLNPIQNEYYNTQTWSIVQAFTSPLSIFYRFHSSVCLADIWQEVYHDKLNHRYFRSESQSNRVTKINHISMV
ncbi:unnamed protein product [Rotaria socialis]|uniref:Uncharacterized protein n=1 Tax=Rotaria socialis TaxID=392032 RepID=A0A818PLA5_9BILA|nr:unnamed protein product [Rotaria socialis]CAF4241215.1 unnamed protein product [Rotaria socialis]